MEIAKIAAITLGLGLATFGGYQVIQKSDTKMEVEVKQAVNTPSPEQRKVQITAENNINAMETEAPAVFQSEERNADAPQPLAPEKAVVQAGKFNIKPAIKEVVGETAVSEAYEPNTKSTQPLTGTDIDLPEDGISNKSALESIHPEVVIKRDNRNIFHYQFSENKLVLYADLSDKLYEVLELNQDNTKRMFFCYDSHFYALDPNQLEIAPLKEVLNKDLVQILSAYQKRKN
jgi:hypothetical protein